MAAKAYVSTIHPFLSLFYHHHPSIKDKLHKIVITEK